MSIKACLTSDREQTMQRAYPKDLLKQHLSLLKKSVKKILIKKLSTSLSLRLFKNIDYVKDEVFLQSKYTLLLRN